MIQCLDKGFVDLIDCMGSDLTVVNAARVSFAKRHDSFDEDKDAKLIGYLAKHGHWTPFGHPQITLHFKAPIFLARQFVKHQIGFVWNEVSRRYVDDEPEFYWTENWRSRPKNAKQGSGEDFVLLTNITKDIIQTHMQLSRDYYNHLIKSGVAPELARIILPQATYTEWYWTGSLAAWARMYKLRSDIHAQLEAQEYAQAVGQILENLFPISWKALTNGQQSGSTGTTKEETQGSPKEEQ